MGISYNNGFGGVISIQDYNPNVQGQQGQQGPQGRQNGGNQLSISLNGSSNNSNKVSKKEYNKMIGDMVDQFHDATYQWGTDDEVFEDVLSKVDSDNIIDVYKAWNKYHSAEDGESFFEAFSDDASRDQLRVYTKSMARALRDKAEELGCYDEEMAKDFAHIDNNFRPRIFGIRWRQGNYLGLLHTDNEYKILDKIAQRIIEAEADQLAANEVDDEDKENVKKEHMRFAQPLNAIA